MTDRNRTYQNKRVSTHSDVQCGSANRQTPPSGRGNARTKLPFSGHTANKLQRPTIPQLNIEGLTASKMNVLHHLAMQSEALIILLQETHCTDAEKLVPPNYQLAGSSLSRKHGLATSVHERLRYTLLDQSPPILEIEWLCVDTDGYKIVNVHKLPPTRLRTLDLPVFPHPCLYAGNFNCRHADWGYDDNSPDGKRPAGRASVNCPALPHNAKDAARPVGMGLPRAAWVGLGHLQTGVGRFHSSMHKWGLAPSLNCECGASEQTADHVLTACPIHRAQHGARGLTVLDDETRCWLNDITASV